jgi:hypothetical protein
MKYSNLTPNEKQWISKCKKLMSKMPRKLWLYNGSGEMSIMKYPKEGDILNNNARVDPENKVDGIRCDTDGGDW